MCMQKKLFYKSNKERTLFVYKNHEVLLYLLLFSIFFDKITALTNRYRLI